jgi:HlyD family secretion protein
VEPLSRSMPGVASGPRSLLTRPRVLGVVALAVVAVAIAGFVRSRSALDDSTTATVRRGDLTPVLTASGVLRAVDAVTYRSLLRGRETAITFLVAEGTRVNEGDLLITFDRVTLDRDLERATQELRQTQVDVQVAEIDRQEARAAIDSLSGGEAALSAEETKTRLQLSEKRAERLRQEHAMLLPLMERGFITREELRKTADELERAEEDLTIARRRNDVLVERSLPRDRQKAELTLAQKDAQHQNALARLREAEVRVSQLREDAENASLYARGPGLVVHEDFLNVNPRRKIRVGDRVTETTAIVTVADVNRMMVETSISEADIQRVSVGQPVTVIVEAFRERRFQGSVARLGTMARASAERPFEDRRFELIAELSQPEADLKPEMSARIDVHLQPRTGVLIVPATAIFDEGGAPVVRVVAALGLESRPVQVGQSTGTEVEIVAGVAEGDRVALLDNGVASPRPGTAPSSSGYRSVGGGSVLPTP